MNKKGISTLGNFEKILKVKNYSKNTVNIYVHYMKEFIMYFDKPALHITLKDIYAYVQDYNYTSTSKQNQIYSAIKVFSKYMLNINLDKKIQLERPRMEKKLPRIIDNKYLLKKIHQIKNIKHKAIIALGYSVGLRVSEVISLKIKDIDSKRMIINIRQSKGRKDRIVPLTKSMLDILRKYYKEYKPKEYLFNGQFSFQYSKTSCNNIVKKYIGEHYHFHLLRHSCMTNLTEKGIDLRVIQKLAGHKSSRTTEIYTHVSKNILNSLPLAI